MIPAPLPPIARVAVSVAARRAYVLRHFELAYPGAPAVTIGEPGSQSSIEIADQSHGFFAGSQPYPPAPSWRAWQGRPVPFLFDKYSETQLLVFAENRAVVAADIISAAFYLLSGWQEYFSPKRDHHGRFPYAASVQQRHDFVTLPVVNYYFDVLRAAVEHVSGQTLTPRRWGSTRAEFTAFISHDIDNIHGGWRAAARQQLRRAAPLALAQLAGRWRRGGPAPWDNLEAVQAASTRYGAPTTFFILGRAQPAANGTPNADYNSHAPEFQQRLAQLAAQGAELACHGSYDAATEDGVLVADIQHLTSSIIIGNRFHYLRWEPTATPSRLAAAGICYDSTLGFAEHFGFRNSYCLPFYPFNFERQQAYEFLEIPLAVMDTTLHHPAYLQLKAAEILPALQPVFAEIKRFGGVAAVLWHNQNFDPANSQNGPLQFHELMTHLQRQGAAFLTGRAIWQEFSNEISDPVSNL